MLLPQAGGPHVVFATDYRTALSCLMKSQTSAESFVKRERVKQEGHTEEVFQARKMDIILFRLVLERQIFQSL